MEEGKCYTFSRGVAKVANKQFNQCKHDYELTFNSDAVVNPVADDADISSGFPAAYVDLKVLKTKALPATVDLIGVIVEAEPAIEITTGPQSKNPGQKLMKSKLKLADESETALEITLFGNQVRS